MGAGTQKLQDMNEKLNNSQIFTTQNRALAIALMTAGCTLHQSEAEGPCSNIYTVGKLRAIGMGGQGLSIEQAAIKAVNAKKPGIISYFFVRDEELEKAIKAWDSTVAKLNSAAGFTEELSTEQIMTVACIHENNRKLAKELPWLRPALVSDVSSNSKKDGEKEMISGSGRVWSLGCSEETRKKLKLPKL